jgi:hypothetical protein
VDNYLIECEAIFYFRSLLDRPSVLVGPGCTRTYDWALRTQCIGESVGQRPRTNGADFGQVQPRLKDGPGTVPVHRI